MGTGDLEEPAASSPMTEASGFSKLLAIYRIPQCHIPGNILPL